MNQELIYDILEYIGKQKCHGKSLGVYIRNNYKGKILLEIRAEDGFNDYYTFYYEDFKHLNTIREKVDSTLNDFRDRYEKMVLKKN